MTARQARVRQLDVFTADIMSMAYMKIDVGSGLADQIASEILALGRAAGAPAGYTGRAVSNGFVGEVSVSGPNGQKIIDDVQRRYSKLITQQNGWGSAALKSWERSEFLRGG